MEPQIGFCTNPDGARIAYATLGQGPAMVFPPGYFASISPYKTFPEIRQLYDSYARYHTVVIYDPLGCGLSDRNRTVFTLESELRNLETVVNHLKLDRIILSGYSSSGPIAVAYAARYPERVTRLVLYGTFANRSDLSEEYKAAVVSLLRQPDNWAGRRTLVSLCASQAQIDYLELMVAMVKDIATPEVAANIGDMDYKLDVTDLCPLVKTPTLVLHRKGDLLIDFKQGVELASLIPSARFVPLEGNIHFNFLGDTESYLRNVFEFLGDPVISSSTDQSHQLVQPGPHIQPKTEHKKKEWLRLDNPLVFILATLIASVLAGIILMLIKC
ncbi:MAG: alpha/beta hydrolase [Dehalococcoidia bacterium]|jgi:pimeloyl-ACP methyl ester carboxylesterase